MKKIKVTVTESELTKIIAKVINESKQPIKEQRTVDNDEALENLLDYSQRLKRWIQSARQLQKRRTDAWSQDDLKDIQKGINDNIRILTEPI